MSLEIINKDQEYIYTILQTIDYAAKNGWVKINFKYGYKPFVSANWGTMYFKETPQKIIRMDCIYCIHKITNAVYITDKNELEHVLSFVV